MLKGPGPTIVFKEKKKFYMTSFNNCDVKTPVISFV
jgi:hypothetical protein